MEAISDVVLQETKTHQSTKRVHEILATSVQELSSTDLNEKTLIVSSALNSSNVGTVNSNTVASGTEEPVSSVLCGGNGNSRSLESELIALKLTDYSGNEIGEKVQEKQQHKTTLLSSVKSVSGSSLSMQQQASTSTVVSENSSTCSSTAPEKPVSVEDEKTVESNKQVAEEQQEATFAIKTCENVEKGTDKANETVQVKETVVENDNETSSITSEEIVEEEEENEDDSAEQKVTEKVLSDGSQTSTTTTVITEHSNPNGTITTETITKKILKEEPQTRSVHSITTTPPTPTTDETKTMNFETKPELSPKDHVEEESDEEEVDEVEMKEKIATERIHQQQVQKDQTIHEADPIKDVTDAPSLRSNTNEPKSEIVSKQGNLNNTIKDIISSIDSNIIAEENMAALKQIDLELLKKQQELAMEIQQQQFLAQKLANENRLLQQQQKELQLSNKKTETIFSQKEQPITNELKYSTFDETQDGNNYSRRSQTMETRESTNVSKKIDLQKIFSPAADAEEILPKNRKLYASSAFYSPTLHPTVEDQVELARKISHSLSDITNHQSKGQSMYVNRKKRSVKWVHEGCGQEGTTTSSVESQSIETDPDNFVNERKENDDGHALHCDKIPLKFLMNPRGQMHDINSCQESINTKTGLLSLDTSAEVVNALQTNKGKGAELFSKRRKVSENWVVDESNVGTQSPSGLPDYHQYQQQSKPSTSPSILPAFTDAAKHRVQLNMHQEQLLEKYAKPGIKVVKTPWEAALESGSANAAFVEDQKLSSYQTPARSPAPQYLDARQGGQSYEPISNATDRYNKPGSADGFKEYAPQQIQQQYKLNLVQNERRQAAGTNPQRDLAYKPSIPQGWKAPNMSLPADIQEYQQQQDITLELERASWEKEKLQLEPQIPTIINTAVGSCREFNIKDEKEIIDLVRDVKLSTVTSPLSSSCASQVISNKKRSDFQEKRQQESKQCEDELNDIYREADMKVNVHKQLQQYEDIHQQHAERQRYEELLQSSNKKSEKSYNHSSGTVSLTTNSEQNVEPQEEYVKVPVRELITNFEQQSQQEIDKRKPQYQPISDNIMAFDDQSPTPEMHRICKCNEDLYVPKEIPLQSYAPPPVAAQDSINISHDYFEPAWKSSNTHQHTYQPLATTALTAPLGGSGSFPITKPLQMGFATSCGNNQPPKQQYLTPESYQTVSQMAAQTVPQLNFSPSPLPYNKLAKFENSTNDTLNSEYRRVYSSPRSTAHLGSKDHNTSPDPFLGSYQHKPHTPSLENSSHVSTPRLSPRPPSSLNHFSGNNARIPQTTFNSILLLNAPSYNSSARGWQCSVPSTGYQAPQRGPMNAHKPECSVLMPYTDF